MDFSWFFRWSFPGCGLNCTCCTSKWSGSRSTQGTQAVELHQVCPAQRPPWLCWPAWPACRPLMTGFAQTRASYEEKTSRFWMHESLEAFAKVVMVQISWIIRSPKYPSDYFDRIIFFEHWTNLIFDPLYSLTCYDQNLHRRLLRGHAVLGQWFAILRCCNAVIILNSMFFFLASPM